MNAIWQQPLPQRYRNTTDADLRQRIRHAKQQLGERLLILGHHYQQDAVIEFADFTGDSFELSRNAARQKQAEFVVFCGVHFMAESADILTDENVKVILPDLGAGCSMADMANLDQTLECWHQLAETCPGQTVVPVTYMNSSAAIKAFVGEHGGAVCTSSNCRSVLQWAQQGGAAAGGAAGVPENPGAENSPSPGTPGEGKGGGFAERRECTMGRALKGTRPPPFPSPGVPGEGMRNAGHRNLWSPGLGAPGVAADPAGKIKVLFFPDQHLGRNTAFAMGYPLDSMVVWDPSQDLGGNDVENLRQSRFVLWKGHCSVHQLFRPEHVDQVRAKYPRMKVIVHPECRWEVVQKSDLTGSTAYIVQQIAAAPPGSQWAVGTEVHLVNRLAHEHPEQKIIVLSDCQCLCTTMFRIDLAHLCWAVENLVEGKVVNQIKVDAETRKWAMVSLDRMLSITAAGKVAAALTPMD